MCDFPCPKCNKKFDKKYNLSRHLNRKISCISVIENSVSVSQNKSSTVITQCSTKFPHKKNNILSNKILDDDNSTDESDLSCKHCHKKFSRTDALKRHISNTCKVKKQKENEKEEIFQQLMDQCNKQKEVNNKQEKMLNTALKQIEVLTGEITKLKSNGKNIMKNCNNTTNTNSNNTTNNIIMMDFGKENLQIVDKSEFIKIVKNNKITGVKITDELVKAIHFNDKYPQLNNIYISDINRQKCMIVENNEWKLSPVDQIPQVIENIVKYSNEKNEELSAKYKDNKTVTARLKVIDKYTKLSDPEYLDELIEDEAPRKEIKRCKDFQQHAYDTVKTTLYNKGKKNKKLIK